jgi:hypothetical protein
MIVCGKSGSHRFANSFGRSCYYYIHGKKLTAVPGKMFVQKIIVRAKKLCGTSLASHPCTIFVYSTTAFTPEVTAQSAGFKTPGYWRHHLAALPFIKESIIDLPLALQK